MQPSAPPRGAASPTIAPLCPQSPGRGQGPSSKPAPPRPGGGGKRRHLLPPPVVPSGKALIGQADQETSGDRASAEGRNAYRRPYLAALSEERRLSCSTRGLSVGGS